MTLRIPASYKYYWLFISIIRAKSNYSRKLTQGLLLVQSTPVISKPDIRKYPLIAKCDISPRVLNAFSSAYNEYTVISKEYTGPLDFDITGVDCSIYSSINTDKTQLNKY